jgi:hypothetical protein
VEHSGIINVGVGLKGNVGDIPFPLRIEILNQKGISMLPPVYNAIPTFTENIFPVNVNSLPSGQYNVWYQIEDEIIVVPFIKQ